MAQQRQRKQSVLTDDKSIFTCFFQPTNTTLTTQYFKTDDIRNSMYTKHNGDNAKLRIFSFIPQRTITYRTQFCESYILNSQPYKHNPNNQNNNINVGFTPLTEILCSYSYNWDNANSGVFIFQLRNKLTNFVHFIHHQFVHFIDPEKPVRDLMNNLVHFTQPNMNPAVTSASCYISYLSGIISAISFFRNTFLYIFLSRTSITQRFSNVYLL